MINKVCKKCKEIYSDKLADLIPNGMTLMKKRDPIYTETQMNKLKRKKLGKLMDIERMDNFK